jgi:hypothetical protein
MFNGYLGSFLRVKQLRHEINHSPPFGAEVKHEWGYVSAPCTCLHGVGRDKFTFAL